MTRSPKTEGAGDAPRVPRWSVALLDLCVRRSLARESLLGDLTDDAVGLARRRGMLVAAVWLRWQLLAIATRYLWARTTGSIAPPAAFTDTHRTSPSSTLMRDLTYAARSLRSTPGTTSSIVAILALALGALVATFSLVHAALLSPLPYAEPDRLVWAATTFDGRPNPAGSALDWRDYRERNGSFSDLGAVTPFRVAVTVVAGGDPLRVNHAYASANLFRLLGVTPAAGPGFTSGDAELGTTSALVSHGFWRRELGGADVIGAPLRINGTDHTIVGVLPEGFRFLVDVDVWRPLQIGGPFASARRFHNWLMVGRLRDGTTLDQAQSDVDAISLALQQEYPDSNRDKALALTPLAEALGGLVGPQLLVMFATTVLVLVVAGSNVAGLLLARGATRQSELAIRAALGASRGRIIRQLVVESLLLGGGAGALGLLLAEWFRRLLLQAVPLDVLGLAPAAIGSNAVLFGLGVTLLVSLAFGTLPALRMAPDRPADSLRGARTTGGHRTRSVLVVAQVALSVVLLIGAALLVRSFALLSRQDPGFDPRQLLSAELTLGSSQAEPESRLLFFEELATRLEASASVEAVALANQLPIRNPGNNIGIWDADNPPEPAARPLAYQRIVRPGYFAAMRIPVVTGRTFAPSAGADGVLEIVLSRDLTERLFPDGGAVGRRVVPDWNGEAGVVIGVVEDVRAGSLADASSPTFYASHAQRPQRTMNMAIRPRGPASGIVAELRAILRELDPEVALGDVRAMQDLIAESVGEPRLLSVAMSGSAATALLLSLVGLYGILAQAVAQRRREFGLRVAVGAEPSAVVALVVRDGMRRIGLGLALGIPAALIAARLLERFLFEVAPADPISYLIVAFLLAAIGLLACLLPARRVLRLDPVAALRSE